MPINKPYYGKGLKFPIEGQFEISQGVDKILEDIQLLLLTSPGERVMRPEFGSLIPTRLWENLDEVADKGCGDISKAIKQFEPRVSLIEVYSRVDRTHGVVLFHIRMIILETNQETNLVFPFKSSADISQQ